MKPLTYILLFIPFLGLGQSSNAPEIVFPMVEQFISEAHQRDVRVYHRIREIDSIILKMMEYPTVGYHFTRGNYEEIQLHERYSKERHFEHTFFHEVGHALGLEHSDNPHSIMFYMANSDWLLDDKNWAKAKDEFFEQLKNISYE